MKIDMGSLRAAYFSFGTMQRKKEPALRRAQDNETNEADQFWSRLPIARG